jgi:hypothetical protein
VPADERKRFLEYRGDEFVRSLRLALERRDRVASYVKRLERQRDRAARKARTPALEPGPDAAAAAAGLLLVGSCEPIPEGPDVAGCRSSDTLPAAGPDDDDDPGQPAVGPGDAAAVDALAKTYAAALQASEQDVTSPRKKKLRTVELTVVAQPETSRTTWM